ncbi:hypothetical protein BSG1_11976 [Bacillus sp. SG-1]|nr:hypothetical protein BSG1_11976 [Bacillus sp. SG-1]
MEFPSFEGYEISLTSPGNFTTLTIVTQKQPCIIKNFQNIILRLIIYASMLYK